MSDAIKFRHPPRHEGCDCFLLEGGTFRTGGRCIRGDCDCKQFDGMYAGYEAEVAIAVARLRALHNRRTDVECSAEAPCNWPGCPYGRRVETLPTGAVPSEGARGSISFDEAVNTRPTGAVSTTEKPGAVELKTARLDASGPLFQGVVAGSSFSADPGVGVFEFGDPVDAPGGVVFEMHNTGYPVGGITPADDLDDPSSQVPWTPGFGTAAHLDDANGKCVVADLGGVASPLARELIRLAPDMESRLRDIGRVDDDDRKGSHWSYCAECVGATPVGSPDADICHASDCRLAAILAALDAARKATT